MEINSPACSAKDPVLLTCLRCFPNRIVSEKELALWKGPEIIAPDHIKPLRLYKHLSFETAKDELEQVRVFVFASKI